MAKTVIASTCKECSVRCGSLIYLQDGKVVKITGNPGHPGTAPATSAGRIRPSFPDMTSISSNEPAMRVVEREPGTSYNTWRMISL